MKARTIGRHIRESFKSLGRNSWMTFASVSAVTVTLLLVGVFIVIMMNLNKVADNLENDVEIKMLVDLTADDAAVQQLQQQLKAMDDISEVQYSPKGEELNDLVKDFGEALRLYEQSNPLNDAFYIRAKNPQQTDAVAKEIEKLDHVDKVIYGEDKIERLFHILNLSRNVGLGLILALLFTAMFLISNTIRITIVARGREIEIMKLVGATNNFVRIPFVLEGMWYGVLGSILPIAVVTFGYYKLHEALQPRLDNTLFQILNFNPFILQVDGLILLMGIFIGIWGSFMSVRKFLRV